MKIICATSIPFATEAFAPLGELQIHDPRNITPQIVKNADVLICRSTLKVNQALLEGSSVKFIATCTIGNDHMDLDYLDRKGITHFTAAGCNANSVAEYATCALLSLAGRHGFQLRGKIIGIIGVGNVGSLALKKAEALGMRVLLNDPPRRDAMEKRSLVGRDHALSVVNSLACHAKGVVPPNCGRTGSPALPFQTPSCQDFLPLDEVLAKADIITVHVPLAKTGKYPTFHLAGREFFDRARPGCIFINAARGAVMDSEAFLQARAAGKIAQSVIDCWEGEPAFRLDVMKGADLATPHIAGYSFEGKVMGTVLAYRRLCQFLNIKPTFNHEGLLPPPPVPEIIFDAAGKTDEEALAEIVRRVYDIEADDALFRAAACADAKTRGGNFETMRKNYRMRREFRYTRVILRNASAALADTLRKLEFQVATELIK
jgi:erythronate-4-phosphate dehydrogenase